MHRHSLLLRRNSHKVVFPKLYRYIQYFSIYGFRNRVYATRHFIQTKKSNKRSWQTEIRANVHITPLSCRVCVIPELCVGPWTQHRRCAALCFFCLQQQLIMSRGAKRRGAISGIWSDLIGSTQPIDGLITRAAAAEVSDNLRGHQARLPDGTLMWKWAAVWPLTSEQV